MTARSTDEVEELIAKLQQTERGRNEKLQCVVAPSLLLEAADALEALTVMREALEKLGKCGSCGGKGTYINRGWRGQFDNPPQPSFVTEEVTCTKCDGTGMNPIAREALARIGRS